MALSVNRTCPIKRRTRGDMQALRDALVALLAPAQPVTVRQAFYLAVSAGLIAKTEQEYKSTICRLLGEMRRDGQVPWGWVADHTRWMRKPRSYTSLEQALAETARLYRRNVWREQDAQTPPTHPFPLWEFNWTGFLARLAGGKDCFFRNYIFG